MRAEEDVSRVENDIVVGVADALVKQLGRGEACRASDERGSDARAGRAAARAFGTAYWSHRHRQRQRGRSPLLFRRCERLVCAAKQIHVYAKQRATAFGVDKVRQGAALQTREASEVRATQPVGKRAVGGIKVDLPPWGRAVRQVVCTPELRPAGRR